ncbi:MAG: YhcG family protein [Agathobacter sp.]
MLEDKHIIVNSEEQLFDAISRLIDESRKQVAKAVNTAMVYTYYGVGQYIVEFEQGGKVRAAYGKGVLIRLSARLTEKYGKGWSVETLKKCRKLFFAYSIGSTLQTQSTTTIDLVHTVDQKQQFTLSWNHYQILMRVKNIQERSFYEIEAYNQNWSVRQLQRQVDSGLYERLALSRDKDEVMRLANEGQTIEKPSDIIKNPLVLEFLGLKPEAAYSETQLETAILDKLESFLLECGKGFLFEARQKRFTFDEDNFFVDLVLYNRILQCYVLVDLKIDKLTHQDLGQMMMYVNYFDRYKRLEFEKPTIGILLCKDKNDALVELTLPKDANIYAQQYALCLPKKEELQQKLKEWVSEYEESHDTACGHRR